MKIIISALVALSVLASAGPATALEVSSFYDQQDRTRY